MAEQRLVFPMLVEGFVRVAGPAVTPSLKDALRKLGLDLDRPLPPAWETTHVQQWMDLFAKASFPEAAPDEAMRLMGRAFLQAWQTTLLGGATALVLRTVGPVRSLSKLQRAFRTGDNFTEVVITELQTAAPFHSAHVVLNEVQGRAEYFQGVLEAGALMVGAKNPSVTRLPLEGPGAKFLLRYET